MKRESKMRPLWRMADVMDPAARLLIGSMAVALAIYFGARGLFWAWLGALAGVYLVWDAVRNGSVWAAFAAFRHGELEQTRRFLQQLVAPRWLGPTASAYYHWLRGLVEVSDGRLEAARVQLLVAAAGRLKTGRDRALVHCLLAEVAIRQETPDVARRHLDLAADLGLDAETASLITRLRQRLNGTGA